MNDRDTNSKQKVTALGATTRSSMGRALQAVNRSPTKMEAHVQHVENDELFKADPDLPIEIGNHHSNLTKEGQLERS